MVQLVLDAGERNIRHKKRDCRLIYRIDGSHEQAELLRDEIPADTPVIAIPLDEFREIMTRFGLRFRVRLPPQEAQQRKQQSLEKYRSTAQFKERRRRRGTAELTEQDRAAIAASSDSPLALARRYHLSLRQIDEIKEQVPHGG